MTYIYMTYTYIYICICIYVYMYICLYVGFETTKWDSLWYPTPEKNCLPSGNDR